jgi:hypothetical protein
MLVLALLLLLLLMMLMRMRMMMMIILTGLLCCQLQRLHQLSRSPGVFGILCKQ